MKWLILVFIFAVTSALPTEEVVWEKVERQRIYPGDDFVEISRGNRIANGFDAGEGQFPFTLRLQVHDTDGAMFVCSGVLIGPTHFLTVRHCFDPVLTFLVMAFAGTVEMNGSGWIHRNSTQFWFAPPIDGWNPDLAVCRLDSPFPASDRIAPIRLPSRSQMNTNYPFAQYPINIIGWGRIADGSMAQRLQWARFRIETSCWTNPRPTTMCSVPVDGWHIETRGGDSGGPWATVEGGIPTLIALTEGSTGNQQRWWFRGTRLTSFLSWISSVTGIPIRD